MSLVKSPMQTIVETLVGACDELSLLLRALEITRTQDFIAVKSVSEPSEPIVARRVDAAKREGLLSAGRSLRRSLKLHTDLVADMDAAQKEHAPATDRDAAWAPLGAQAHLALMYQALSQDKRIVLECVDGDFSMLISGALTLRFSVEEPRGDHEAFGTDPLRSVQRLALARVLRAHFARGLVDQPALVGGTIDLVHHVALRVELVEVIRKLRAGGLACLPAWTADPAGLGVPQVDAYDD